MSSSSKSWSPKWDDTDISFDKSQDISLSEQLELDNRAVLNCSGFSFSRLEGEYRRGTRSASEVLAEIQAFLLKSNQHRSFELMQQIKTFSASLPGGKSLYEYVSNVLEKRRLVKEKRKTHQPPNYRLPPLVQRSSKHPIEHRRVMAYQMQTLHNEQITQIDREV